MRTIENVLSDNKIINVFNLLDENGKNRLINSINEYARDLAISFSDWKDSLDFYENKHCYTSYMGTPVKKSDTALYEIYQSELLKLNKSDVSRSANIQSCKECGIFVFTPDGKMCMNGHFC